MLKVGKFLTGATTNNNLVEIYQHKNCTYACKENTINSAYPNAVDYDNTFCDLPS